MARIIRRTHPKFPYIVRIYKPTQRQWSFATRKEAEGWLPEARVIERGGRAETFQSYAERWHDQTKRAKRSSYVQKIESYFRNYLFPAFGRVPLDEITREDVKAFLTAPDMTAATGRSVGMLLSAILNEAVKDKRIPENPARGLKVAYEGKRADLTPVTFAQLEIISASLGQWALIPWLQYGAGLRIGEAMAVRADGVIEDGTVLRVEQQVNRNRRNKADGPSVGPMKHRTVKNSSRDIPLAGWLRERIEAHIKEHEIPDDGYLFPDLASGRMSAKTYDYRFNVGRVKAGVPELVTHMLRHHFASNMLAALMPVPDVSKWLGHKNIQITFDTYYHLMKSSADKARMASDDQMNQFKEG